MQITIILIIKPILRYLAGRQIAEFIYRLLSDKYTQNLMELWPAGHRISLLNILEINLRAKDGKIIIISFTSSDIFSNSFTVNTLIFS